MGGELLNTPTFGSGQTSSTWTRALPFEQFDYEYFSKDSHSRIHQAAIFTGQPHVYQQPAWDTFRAPAVSELSFFLAGLNPVAIRIKPPCGRVPVIDVMVDVDTGGMIGIGESLRDLINKSQEVAREHPEQTGQVLNKVEYIVDEQTRWKHSEKIGHTCRTVERRFGEQAPPRQ